MYIWNVFVCEFKWITYDAYVNGYDIVDQRYQHSLPYCSHVRINRVIGNALKVVHDYFVDPNGYSLCIVTCVFIKNKTNFSQFCKNSKFFVNQKITTSIPSICHNIWCKKNQNKFQREKEEKNLTTKLKFQNFIYENFTRKFGNRLMHFHVVCKCVSMRFNQSISHSAYKHTHVQCISLSWWTLFHSSKKIGKKSYEIVITPKQDESRKRTGSKISSLEYQKQTNAKTSEEHK